MTTLALRCLVKLGPTERCMNDLPCAFHPGTLAEERARARREADPLWQMMTGIVKAQAELVRAETSMEDTRRALRFLAGARDADPICPPPVAAPFNDDAALAALHEAAKDAAHRTTNPTALSYYKAIMKLSAPLTSPESP